MVKKVSLFFGPKLRRALETNQEFGVKEKSVCFFESKTSEKAR